MKNKIMIIVIVLSVILISRSSFAKDYMLPFPGGETWSSSQGNHTDEKNEWGCYAYSDENHDKKVRDYYHEADDTNGDGKVNCLDTGSDYKWQWYNRTHRDGGQMAYAWDFNSANDYGKPLVAANDGEVYDVLKNHGGWGNLVIIEFSDGNRGWYPHLLDSVISGNDYRIPLEKDDPISQGQTIGYCGSTGYSTSSHEHFHVQDANGNPVNITFLDAEESDGIPKEGGYYTSLNTYNSYQNNSYRIGKFADGWRIRNFPPEEYNTNFTPLSRSFAITYFHVGKPDKPGDPNKLGNPINAVHQYPDYYPWPCNNNITAESVWVQDTQSTNGDGKIYTLVLNPYVINLRLDYPVDGGVKYWLGVVFSLEGPMRNYWFDNFCELGPPASELFEKTINGVVYKSQMFENGDNNYIKVSYREDTKVFNSPEYVCDDHVNQSVYAVLGCPNGDCGTGGGESNPDPDSDPNPTPNPYPGISCNKEIGFTPEGFTRVDQVCYRQPFYNNYPIRETAMEYVDEGQNPADIMYSGNPTGYSLMPDAIPVLDQTGMKVIFEDDFND
ncbi:MAG: M23 family metallopeptidase, partial [Patescibacteria group bacterium]